MSPLPRSYHGYYIAAMVLHDLAPRRPMTDYGIQIPILHSNTQRSLEYLLGRPDLAARREEWLIQEEIAPLSRQQIARVHDADYARRLTGTGDPRPLREREPTAAEREVMRTYELVNEDGSYHRFDPTQARFSLIDLRDQALRIAAGTIRAAEIALDGPDRFCFYFGGGMHHGQYDFGEGFCPVNDLVVAVKDLQSRGRIQTAWVVDVDAHKGDGTAALTAEDPSVSSLSIHMANGWPLDQPLILADGRPNPSYVASDVDIPVDSGEEAEYLQRLQSGMDEMETRFALPDLVVVVDGSDPYERDQLPSTQLLKLSLSQMLERDLFLYRWIREREIPTAFVMAGNYGYHSWEVYSQFLERQIRGIT